MLIDNYLHTSLTRGPVERPVLHFTFWVPSNPSIFPFTEDCVPIILGQNDRWVSYETYPQGHYLIQSMERNFFSTYSTKIGRCRGSPGGTMELNQKGDIAMSEDVDWEIIARVWLVGELNSGYFNTFLFWNTVLFFKKIKTSFKIIV